MHGDAFLAQEEEINPERREELERLREKRNRAICLGLTFIILTGVTLSVICLTPGLLSKATAYGCPGSGRFLLLGKHCVLGDPDMSTKGRYPVTHLYKVEGKTCELYCDSQSAIDTPIQSGLPKSLRLESGAILYAFGIAWLSIFSAAFCMCSCFSLIAYQGFKNEIKAKTPKPPLLVPLLPLDPEKLPQAREVNTAVDSLLADEPCGMSV
jgi:hypothetical protein